MDGVNTYVYTKNASATARRHGDAVRDNFEFREISAKFPPIPQCARTRRIERDCQ